MRRFLETLLNHQDLTENEAIEAILLLANGEANPTQAAAFLMGIQQKSITTLELTGFRKAMLQLALPLDFEEFEAMDVCGTGGDGKNTFNISTTSAFVVAGAGIKVAKHGNHGVSSAVGSSTVLEHLGVKFTNNSDFLRKKLEAAGICYLHAPLFHPAMKYIAPVRRDLGIKTFFNIMGPLINPAKVNTQLVGVSDLKTFDLYAHLFRLEQGRFAVIHALDGYDEISLTGSFQVANREKMKVLTPEDIGLKRLNATELHGGDTLESSAKIMLALLQGQGKPAHVDAVLANAGLAISVAKEVSWQDGINQARESIDSGKAYQSLKKLVE